MRLLIFLFVAACSSSAAVPLGTAFAIGAGETKKSDGATVEVVSINDSRCPPSANCVWEGDAEVELKVNGQRAVVHTHGGANYPRSAAVAGYTVTLRDVRVEKPHIAVLIVERD